MIFDTLFLAAAQPAPSGGDAIMQMMPMVAVMMAIMYFGMIRPERRKAKERRAMMEGLKSGDRVMVAGGILGTVTNTKEESITVKVADGVKIEVARAGINKVLGKDDKIGTDVAA